MHRNDCEIRDGTRLSLSNLLKYNLSKVIFTLIFLDYFWENNYNCDIAFSNFRSASEVYLYIKPEITKNLHTIL